MGEILFKELLGLKKQIELMPKSVKRDYLLIDYIHLFKCLDNLGYRLNDDLLDFDHVDKVREITTDEPFIQILEFIIDNDFLHRKIKEVLKEYHDYNFYANNSFNTKINTKNINIFLTDFFKSLGDDVFKLYCRLVNEDKIRYAYSNDASGLTFHRMFDNVSNVIMCNQGDELMDYYSFVHEVGHVYQFYLQRNISYLSDAHYGTEITSRLFEKLWQKYLLDNHLYSRDINEAIKSYHNQNINLYAHCSLISEIVKSGNYTLDESKIVHNLSKEDLERRLENKCGYVFNYIKDLDYINFLYVIGDIISSNLYLEIIMDKKEGLKKLRNYLVNLNNYNLLESFDLYGDIDNAKAYIKNDLEMLGYNKIDRKVRRYGRIR